MKLSEQVNDRIFYNRKIILQVLDFEIADAYWVSPSGGIRAVTTTHIADVIKNPVEFGTTDKAVLDAYNEFGEKFPVEGLGRDKIVYAILKRGWMRIRYQRSDGHFDAEMWDLNEKIKEFLYEWAFKFIENDSKNKTRRVIITVDKVKTVEQYTLQDLITGVFINNAELESLVGYYLVPLSRNENFLSMLPVHRMRESIDAAIQEIESKLGGGNV